MSFNYFLGENDDINYPHIEREPTQLSEDFERHFKISSENNFTQEEEEEDDDMDDPNKAATLIQASYRGYKTRKELGTTSPQSNPGHDQHQSLQTHEEYNNTRNKNSMFRLCIYYFRFFI